MLLLLLLTYDDDNDDDAVAFVCWLTDYLSVSQ